MRWKWRIGFVVLLLAAARGVTGAEDVTRQASETARPAVQAISPVVAENEQPGTGPEVWDLAQGRSDPDLLGFTTEISVNRGETVYFKIKTSAASYHLDIYRIGYYGGLGARKITTVFPSAHLPQEQPACLTQPIDCAAWGVSAVWPVPPTAVSGVYVAKLLRTDARVSNSSHILFVVRDDARRSDLLFQTSDTTWQAYNPYGGRSQTSLYNGGVKVSYNRPLITREVGPINSFFGAEYAMVRWLERNGYDVTYATGVDSARRGQNLLAHKVFLSVGHDEYWSADQRSNVEAARAAGVHLAFFSGNEIYWKTRWEADHHTMVCYKETSFSAASDPSAVFTGTWRDPRFRSAEDPARPENALSGTLFAVNNTGDRTLVVPAADGRMRIWRDTAAAAAPACGATDLAPRTLGYEWDQDEDNGWRPAGLVRLSTTYAHHAPVLSGPGTGASGSFFNEVSGTSVHHLTLYRHPSGALVFGAGTIQWSWGLDANHLHGTGNLTMQQATVNLLADMGVQPGSLASGLVPAQASSDIVPPVSAITWPRPGSTVRYGTAVTITGTATDTAGRVGGVEVSVDGGVTWHPAEGRERFRYLWMASTTGPADLRSRAVDDSGNLESPGAGVSVEVGCLGPCSLFPAASAPANPWTADPFAVEVGVRFQSDAFGVIAGLRYYKGPGNTGRHTAHLWSADGRLLAAASFGRESAPGWQTATFPQPVEVQANTLYVASYSTETGYAQDLGAFAGRGLYAPPLRVRPAGGVYRYGPPGTFPDQTAAGANYWVDVLFEPGRSQPRGLWSGSPVPGTGWRFDPEPVEVGVRFRSDSDGYVTGIRFFKGSGNTGPHVVNLWAPTPPATSPPAGGGGRLLSSGTSQEEAGAGWQVVSFPRPVPITAGIEYTASYHTASGYAYDPAYYSSPMDADPPLHALGGVFQYGKSAFPGQSSGGANYWVDPVVVPTASFPASFWHDGWTPRAAWEPDPQEVEVGGALVPEVDGYVTAIRFYKHPANDGPHTVSLWSAAGSELATAVAAGESACGWQSVALGQPVAVRAGERYIASYHSITGYSKTPGFWSLKPLAWRGIWSPPLRMPASGEPGAGSNGLFRYGPHAFPDQTWKDSNYWVDVVFETRLPPS
ncbi:MAG: DUF4082 domain-containing protein [Acidobacteriota bacterium]|nr:DUF4082 domain-containing protein [Acidobacteriota bacterium]